MALAGLASSMTVNILVTGLIVFKILKVSLEVKATSVEKTLGSTGGTKLRNIIFIIIESGMALFAIQLVRLVLSSLRLLGLSFTPIALNFVIAIHEMLNVIIPFIFCVLLTTFTWPGHRTNNNFGAGFNEIVLR